MTMKPDDFTRNAKGDALLAKYALMGDDILNEPEAKALLGTIRKGPLAAFYEKFTDAEVFERLMRTLASAKGATS